MIISSWQGRRSLCWDKVHTKGGGRWGPTQEGHAGQERGCHQDREQRLLLHRVTSIVYAETTLFRGSCPTKFFRMLCRNEKNYCKAFYNFFIRSKEEQEDTEEDEEELGAEEEDEDDGDEEWTGNEVIHNPYSITYHSPISRLLA